MHEIIEAFPDVDNSDIHKIRYTGSATTLMATEKAKERIKHFRSNISINNSRSQTMTAQNNVPPTSPTAPPSNSIISSSNHNQESRVQRPRSRSVGRQPSSPDLPPPYTEIQPPINPYYNSNGAASYGNTQNEPNSMQQNSSFNGSLTNGVNTHNNTASSGLNDSQLSNLHQPQNYTFSTTSNNCSANLSRLSQSSSFTQSPTRTNDNSVNTSQAHSNGYSRSLYPNLNTSQSSNEIHPIDITSPFPTPEHLNELRYSVNRLSLGNDQF